MKERKKYIQKCLKDYNVLCDLSKITTVYVNTSMQGYQYGTVDGTTNTSLISCNDGVDLMKLCKLRSSSRPASVTSTTKINVSSYYGSSELRDPKGSREGIG